MIIYFLVFNKNGLEECCFCNEIRFNEKNDKYEKEGKKVKIVSKEIFDESLKLINFG